MGNETTRELCIEALRPLADSFSRTADLSAVDEFFDAFDVDCSWYYMKNAFKVGSTLEDLTMDNLIWNLKKKEMRKKSVTHIRRRMREEFLEFLDLYDEIYQQNPRISVMVFIKLFQNIVKGEEL